jgi:hypothetical protein
MELGQVADDLADSAQQFTAWYTSKSGRIIAGMILRPQITHSKNAALYIYSTSIIDVQNP